MSDDLTGVCARKPVASLIAEAEQARLNGDRLTAVDLIEQIYDALDEISYPLPPPERFDGSMWTFEKKAAPALPRKRVRVGLGEPIRFLE